jgi:uncharacterized protein (TIGR02996 family)
MDEDEGFLQAIFAAPDDLTLPLVYADWLEERGDVRGEYLRCRVARASLQSTDPQSKVLLQREKELRQQHPGIIVPWQRRLLLGHILHLVGRKGKEVEPSDLFRPKPCLTEEEVSAWESVIGVRLPEEYRIFLLEVGNGGMQPGSYCDFVVRPLSEVEGHPDAGMPFPVTAERLRDRFDQLEAEGRTSYGPLFPELAAHWEETEQPPGCLIFGQYPSGDGLFLVTAGELRGSVWCTVSSGIPVTDGLGDPGEFLAWFAGVLAEFKDEV